MSKHTPGPWEAISAFLNNDANRAMVAHKSWGGPTIADCGIDKPETMGNARLIAAAPDLLAALEWALDDPDSEILGSEWAQQARAAIRKARGE